MYKHSFRYYICRILNLPIIRKVTPDRWFLSVKYRDRFGVYPDLKNPKTFNEKLQWIKLYDRNPTYSNKVDKFKVRQYISQVLGKEYLIPLVGGPWKHFDEIDFNKLPNQFVLKCTHDSNSVVICTDKKSFDFVAAKKRIEKALKLNYFYFTREWPYKNVEPQIIAEQFMVDESGEELKDYKIYCFNGEPKFTQVIYGRFGTPCKNVYDTSWNYMPMASHFPTDPNANIPKPEKYEDMLKYAAKLSTGIPFLRVDFYVINGKIYFGELTFFPGSGLIEYEPEEWNMIMGDWINLNG